ncbi:MAG: HD domain-containing protein, partial [Prevotella sp.]|nr:HD domain-containing protein [Prevotella sp.]
MSEYVLCKIIRYNNRTRLQNESVAEHTCFVSVFCLKIMAQLDLDHETERQILILAALHDMAESQTSDIPHNVKANYPEMESILEKIETDYYKETWVKYFEVVYKPGNLVYNILKLADAYSVYQY